VGSSALPLVGLFPFPRGEGSPPPVLPTRSPSPFPGPGQSFFFLVAFFSPLRLAFDTFLLRVPAPQARLPFLQEGKTMTLSFLHGSRVSLLFGRHELGRLDRESSFPFVKRENILSPMAIRVISSLSLPFFLEEFSPCERSDVPKKANPKLGN